MCVGNRLLTTFEVDTGAGKWIGYQILYELGLGLSFKVPNLVAQASLPKRDVPTGLALVLFGTLPGASVFISTGENVIANQLMKRLAGVKRVDASMITSVGPTSMLQSFRTVCVIPLLLHIRVGLIPTCLSGLGAASLECRSVKKPAGEKGLVAAVYLHV
ncbi:hypothetical protein BDV09DRAFT_179453 [Aspergillus tetrazonus]